MLNDAHGIDAINARSWSLLDAVGLADKVVFDALMEAEQACSSLPAELRNAQADGLGVDFRTFEGLQ